MAPISFHRDLHMESGLMSTARDEKATLRGSLYQDASDTHTLDQEEQEPFHRRRETRTNPAMSALRRFVVIIAVGLCVGLTLGLTVESVRPRVHAALGLSDGSIKTSLAAQLVRRETTGGPADTSSTQAGSSTSPDVSPNSGSDQTDTTPSQKGGTTDTTTSVPPVTQSTTTTPVETPPTVSETSSSTTDAAPPTSSTGPSFPVSNTTSTTPSSSTEVSSTSTTPTPSSSTSASSTSSQESETTTSDESTTETTTTSSRHTITTGTITTSSPVATTLTRTLDNGGNTVITSTSWVDVIPAETQVPNSESGKGGLQNAAAGPNSQAMFAVLASAVIGLAIMA